MKKSFIFLGLCFLIAACDNSSSKTRDADGNCRQAFLKSYNEIKGSSFEVQQNAKPEQTSALADTCRKMLKAYGPESEACYATDMENGHVSNLSTKDLRDDCAKAIKSKFYGVNPED